MPSIRIADMTPTKYGLKSKTIRIIYNSQLEKDGFEYWEDQMKMAISQGYNYEAQKIPCGVCPQCRIDQSKEWAMRCMMEAKEYKENYFITLTYDEMHKPYNEQKEDSNGKIYEDDGTWNGYLEKKDLSAFLKRLREYWSREYGHDGIRFFGCGEYGSQTKRPHYHAIIFNLPIPVEELKVLKITKNGQVLYTSELIERLWGKGLISIGEVTLESAAYVARYSLKKRTGKRAEEWYCEQGQTPEFVNMSRRPGIARNYYEEKKKEIYKEDEMIIGKLQRIPPKYFDKLYDIEYPEEMEKIRKKRKEKAEESQKVKMSKTTKTIKEQLWIEGEQKLAKIKQMKRELE